MHNARGNFTSILPLIIALRETAIKANNRNPVMQKFLPLKVMKLVICRNFILFAIKSWMHFIVKAVLQIPMKHTIFPMNEFSRVHQNLFSTWTSPHSTHVQFSYSLNGFSIKIKKHWKLFWLWFKGNCVVTVGSQVWKNTKRDHIFEGFSAK